MARRAASPSPEALEARSRHYYDRIAADYDAMIETPRNRAIRACFWQCAEQLLARPGTVLDFGAGTGLDAVHFARLGHRVVAFEHSSGMAARLRDRCAGQLAEGSVELVTGPLAEARETLARRAPFDAILCNFAVLSTVARPRPLFDLFARLTRPGGTVLISIQNAWHLPSLASWPVCTSLLAWPWTGVRSVASADQGRIFHHSAGQLRRAAGPAFVREPSPAPACRARQFGWRSPFRLIALRRV